MCVYIYIYIYTHIYDCMCAKSLQLCVILLRPCRLWPARLPCPWDSPSKNTGVGCHAVLQGFFPTQVWNPGLPHCRQILYVWATREAEGKGGEILFFLSLGTYYPAFDITGSLVNRMNWNKTNYFSKHRNFPFSQAPAWLLDNQAFPTTCNSLTNR